MKQPLALTVLLVVLAAPATEAAQPNIRTQSQNPDSQRQAERSSGIGGFFRGVVGEIREGGEVISNGFRDMRNGIRSRSESGEAPRNQQPGRFGYQSPPPSARGNVAAARGSREPLPPARGTGRFGIEGAEPVMPTSAPRQRTLTRKPAESAPAPAPVASRPPAPAPKRETPPPAPVKATPKPRVETPPAPKPAAAPVKRTTPVVDKTPAPTTPQIVAPKKKEPAPEPAVVDLPAPPEEEVPPAPTPAPAPAPEPKPEIQPIAKDTETRPAPEKPVYPTATATKDPGFVRSPYPPHDMLDVKGMAPGSLAKDPATGQIFRVP